jgi:hypothetical protein
MTLPEFSALLITADPTASHYDADRSGNYTVWAEYGTNDLHADSKKVESVWKIQIDRFTKIEYDPVAAAITDMLDENCIAYKYLVDYEPDTGYIHHIWDCEVD